MRVVILLALVAVMGMVPALSTTALADPTTQGEDEGDQGLVVSIASADDLARAIKNQADGQTWNLASGTYDLGEEQLAQYEDVQASGRVGWYLPLAANNITINGNGATLTSSVVRPDGAWPTQNFITVSGSDVTINDVNIICKREVNKAIEILGKNFSMSDSEVLPVDGGNSGSIYFNNAGTPGNIGDARLTNVTVSSWIANANLGEGDTLTLDGVTVDFSGNEYASDPIYAPIRNNRVTLTGAGLTVKADDAVADFEDQVIEQLPTGAVLSLQSDLELGSTLNIMDKNDLTIEGNGHTITAAGDFTTDEFGQLNLVKPQSCTNLTLRDVKLAATSANRHALDVYGCAGVSLQNVTLDHGASTVGAPLVNNGSTITVDGPLTLVTGEGSWYAANVDRGGALVVNEKNGGSVSFSGDASKAAVFTEDPDNVTIDLGSSGEDLGGGWYGKAAARIGAQGYLTLADAVEAAQTGDTVVPSAGEHVGCLDLTDKSLTIEGPSEGEAVIAFDPQTCSPRTYLDDLTAWPTVYSNTDLALRNVTLSGPSAPGSSIDGVYVAGGDLTLDGVTIKDMSPVPAASPARTGETPSGRGVVFGGSGDLSITGGTITGFQNDGIDTSTTGSVTINGTTITGFGGQSAAPQRGIVLRSGTARIINATISGMAGSALARQASGSVAIDVFDGATAHLAGNVLSADNDAALYLEDGAHVVAAGNQILAPVYNFGTDEVDLSGNYWGEDPDFGVLAPPTGTGGTLRVFPRYAEASMGMLVDENGDPVEDPEPEPTTHQVTFVFGVSGVDDVVVEVEDGATVSAPSSLPTAVGYTFAHWYADKGLTREFDFSVPITEDTTVYAGWYKLGSSNNEVVGAVSSDDVLVPRTGDATSWASFATAAVLGVVALGAGAVVARRHR